MKIKAISLFLTLVLSFGLLCGCEKQGSGEAEATPTPAPTPDILQKSDPGEDDTINILMIGNSFCYYFVEELYGLARTAKIKMRVCNVYYSGCTLEQHYTWWKNGESNYEFFVTDERGRVQSKNKSLEDCIKYQNWDIITLQEASSSIRSSGGVEPHLEKTKTYRTELLGYLREQFPASKFYWHQTWSNQIGYDRNGYKVESFEQQQQDMERTKQFTLAICKEFGIDRINTGEAWQIVRAGGYDNLCARLKINNNLGDYYHDGDIGGGQYLNACVWFETITGKSCVGNMYRPTYYYEEELIQTLQQAAHKAVEDKISEDK